MARYTGPMTRKSRRLKVDLVGADQAFERRPYPPGQHGRIRIKETEYLLQLREKQKAKRIYGVLEKQFRRYYGKASRQKGITGENLLFLLETRLDNVVCRGGLASSRKDGRQMVRHGHMTVNGRKVDIPSYLTKPGDAVGVSAREKAQKLVKANVEVTKGRGRPSWLELDEKAFAGKVLSSPTRDEVSIPIQEQLIIELMSK